MILFSILINFSDSYLENNNINTPKTFRKCCGFTELNENDDPVEFLKRQSETIIDDR